MLRMRILACIGIVLLGGCATARHTASPGGAPSITIAIEAEDLPRYHVNAPEGLTGFDPDIARALCQHMDASCKLVAVPFPAILQGLVDGKYDAAMPLDFTPERASLVDFTEPYLHSPYVFLKMKGTSLQATEEGLANKTIAIERICPGWESGRTLTGTTDFLTGKFHAAVLKPYDMLPECPADLLVSLAELRLRLPDQLRDLDSGVVDAIFGNKMLLHDAVIMAPMGRRYEFTAGEYFDFTNGTAIAIRKNRPQLLKSLNAALEAILRDGTYQAIQSRHFPFDMYGLH